MNRKLIIAGLLILAVVIAGCVGTGSAKEKKTIRLLKSEAVVGTGTVFNVFHDDELNVTCWHMDIKVTNGEAGNCIPDSQLEK